MQWQSKRCEQKKKNEEKNDVTTDGQIGPAAQHATFEHGKRYAMCKLVGINEPTLVRRRSL